MDYNSFIEDNRTFDAVVRNFEIIGEASTHIPIEIQKEFTEIEWVDIRGIRIVFVHRYFDVEPRTLWNMVVQELPRIKPVLQRIKDKYPYA